MKKLHILTVLLFSSSVFAQKAADQQAIKSMCGCYEVAFNFAETFRYPTDTAGYKPSKVKHEQALEWVELVEDSPDKIVLQHLLVLGESYIIKHWRQEWAYQNTHFYDYNGFTDWNFLTKKADEVAGQWTQKVYEVDDRPRYEASASWIHTDGRHYWESSTNAPLPRREYTQRSDYNVTRRTNVHEITPSGWVHDQDNDKIIKTADGKQHLLAQEKGHNIYTKVADSECKAAQKWWKENHSFWAKVRSRWQAEFDKNNHLQLAEKIDNEPLYMHLQALKNTASQQEIDHVIEKFIVKE